MHEIEQHYHLRPIAQILTRPWACGILERLTEEDHQSYADIAIFIRQRDPAASDKLCTETLRRLRENGLVARSDFADGQRRSQYSLTPTGHAFLHLLHDIQQWIAAYGPLTSIKRTPPSRTKPSPQRRRPL